MLRILASARQCTIIAVIHTTHKTNSLIGNKYIKLTFIMEQAQYSKLFSFLWNIANDVLVHAFEKGKYKDIIMPMLVLRRIERVFNSAYEKVSQNQ